MGFFKKLFGSERGDGGVKPVSPSEQEIREAPEDGEPGDRLQRVLLPFLREGTRLELQRASRPLPLTASKFGGTPFGIQSDTWPVCEECSRPLSFICQVDLRQTVLAGSFPFDLFQFFHCRPCYPWGDEDEGKQQWLIRTYVAPESLEAAALSVPDDPHALPECQVLLRPSRFLPDWLAAENLCPEAIEIATTIEPHGDPIGVYERAALKIIGETHKTEKTQREMSRIGGYPDSIQGDVLETPAMFLAQIGSEEAADLMWGDAGSVYLFVCDTSPCRFELTKQCY